MKKIKEFIAKYKTLVICVLILALIVASVLLFGWVGLWYDIVIAAIVGIALTGMNKHGLLKVLSILLLIFVIVSYILPGRQGAIDRIGIADIPNNFLSIVVQNFAPIILFALAVGGFYGILSKTPSYKKILDSIVTKAKPMGKKFIYITIILFAFITALTGITMPLFIFVPFVVTIILLLGYDKLVAFSATVASMLVGYIGGVFVSFINPNTGICNTFETFVGLESKFDNVFPKLLLLFAGVALLVYFVSTHIKKVEEKKVKYELNDNSELLIAEVKGKYKDIKTWPLIVILSLTFIILVIGMVPWGALFNITVFSKFHSWLLGLHIKEFYIFSNIISSNLPALGEWNGSGNPTSIYVYSTMLLGFVSFILALANKDKLDDALDNFLEGAKKMLPAAGLITVAYLVLVCVFNNGLLETIISNYGKFNYGLSSLLAFVGCILNVDLTWITISAYSPILTQITDESIYPSVALLFQSIYGVFGLVGPTSLILILGLSYFDIPYTTWLKYIWRFILYLLILVALVTLLIVLL